MRAILSQALVDQYEGQDIPVATRLSYIYALSFPTRWDLQVVLTKLDLLFIIYER